MKAADPDPFGSTNQKMDHKKNSCYYEPVDWRFLGVAERPLMDFQMYFTQIITIDNYFSTRVRSP